MNEYTRRESVARPNPTKAWRTRGVGSVSVAALLFGAGSLSGCLSDPGALFSASGVIAGSGSSGQLASAGNPSGGADDAGADDGGGAPSAGAASGGVPSQGGAGGGAGESLAGAPAAGAPSKGGAGGGGGDGGTSGGGGMAGGMNPNPSACDGQTVVPDASIADFEAGVVGWAGYLGADPYAVESSQPGAALTEHALRFNGGKAKTSGFFRLLPCRDVSDYDGIQFWAKGKGGDLVRFLAVIPGTDPTPGIGDCHEPEMKCSDHPGKLFTFSGEWKLYQAPWSELKQYGWGTKATFYSVINAVLWINDGPVENFDFSIDEVSLYKNASD